MQRGEEVGSLDKGACEAGRRARDGAHTGGGEGHDEREEKRREKREETVAGADKRTGRSRGRGSIEIQIPEHDAAPGCPFIYVRLASKVSKYK